MLKFLTDKKYVFLNTTLQFFCVVQNSNYANPLLKVTLLTITGSRGYRGRIGGRGDTGRLGREDELQEQEETDFDDQRSNS